MSVTAGAGSASGAWSEGRGSELVCREVVSLVDIDHRLGSGSTGHLVRQVRVQGKLTQSDRCRGGRRAVSSRPRNQRKVLLSTGDGSAATQQLAGRGGHVNSAEDSLMCSSRERSV